MLLCALCKRRLMHARKRTVLCVAWLLASSHLLLCCRSCRCAPKRVDCAEQSMMSACQSLCSAALTSLSCVRVEGLPNKDVNAVADSPRHG